MEISTVASGVTFGLAGYAVVIGVADYYTTMIGLQNGLMEGNPIARWLQAKIGLVASTFITLALAIFGIVLLCERFGWAAIVGVAIGNGLETFNVIRNFILLKKSKISLK